ncbi:dynamin family protein [Gandjariella thermophila]|uniref:Isoniazid inducible gene protein IniC n=1 Tax=Gandjariella thermophila TaxID=1931992 RepID=A0A4D4J5X0_9PSEU|nr:dynamin family protein [Gandjariella thermophila]GDY30864.1 isoniazid inducible gene protein IniC [Gandjariella thermophila]
MTSATEQQLAGPLSAAVADLCATLRPQVGEATAAGLREVLRRLSAPLQVVVAGRLSSGKSTLVNALIGRRVAPTGVGECTRLVTRFQYGTVDRVEVVCRDGRRQALPFDADGMIPASLGVDPAEVSHLEAYLTNAVLRDLTVIDTPGLGSLDDASVARAESVLGAGRHRKPDAGGAAEELDAVSASAVAGAEAVLYVVTQAVRADDRQVLAAFSAATAGREAGPVNAIAVLNKADTVAPESVEGAGGDVWRAAELLAEKQFRVLKPRVAAVLPVVGLLAETTETGTFTAADAEALRELAALEPTVRDTMLVSADLFTAWDAPVPPATRNRLLERLDLHGIRCALAALDGEPDLTAGALHRRLLAASGLAELRALLERVFRARADGIKAAAALASITALAQDSGDPGERGRVHDAIEALLAKPEAHQLRLLEALTLVSSGAVTMPDDLAEEVLRVGTAADVAEQLGLPGRPVHDLAGYALERAGWWRSFASFGATPAQSRVAHVVHRAYFLIWQRLNEQSP